MLSEPRSLDRHCRTFIELESRDAIFASALGLLTTKFALHMSWVAEPEAGGVRVTSVRGNRTNVSQGTLLRFGRGLAGKVWNECRPMSCDDYFANAAITHDYDWSVAPEDLRAMAATPIRFASRSYGVLLGAYRNGEGSGQRAMHLIGTVAERMGEALFFIDRVNAAARAMMRLDRRGAAAGLRDQLDDVLGALLRDIDDARATLPAEAIDSTLLALARRTRAGLLGVRKSLNSFAGFESVESTPIGNDLQLSLSCREVELLAHVARGATNAEIASDMRLSINTIKSYLRKAMTKLDARNRLEAVIRARAAGFL